VTRSRWGRLADRRAAELLAVGAAEPALVVGAPDGFPVRGARAAVDGAPPAAVFAAVIDTVRPEGAFDDDARLGHLVRACRPGGTLALVACAGGTTESARSLVGFAPRLAALGCDVVRAVPFDLLGLFSPWRARLGTRLETVLAELETYLASPAVRAAVRFLERHVVAALPPSEAGSVAVLARRRAAGEAPAPPPPVPDLEATLASRALAEGALHHLRDDAVVRFAAFLDAEVLAPAGVGFDLVDFIARASAEPGRGRAAVRPDEPWWTPSLDVQRLLTAASHRLAHRAIARLGARSDAIHDGVGLPDTLEYELIAAFNRVLS
jgi:hypothetical protein